MNAEARKLRESPINHEAQSGTGNVMLALKVAKGPSWEFS
jgi:hypothetical protein